HAVGTLCAAAWFLSEARSDRERAWSHDELTPFEQAKDSVVRARTALQDGSLTEGQALLAELSLKSEFLRAQVIQLDDRCDEESLNRHLSGSHGITAEMLGRLFEYYARVAPRDPQRGYKLFVVAKELVRRDELTDASAGELRHSLTRNGLLADLDTISVEWRQESEALRARALSGVESLDSLEGSFRLLRESLGDG